MEVKELIKRARRFAKPFRVTDGKDFRLKDFDPGDTLGYGSEDKPRAKEALAMGVEVLAELQDMLYAQDRWAVLVIFQAMDAAGKDGAIKHVMSGVNPQGCEVYSFKAPSSEDLDHDFMWRCMKCLPERGRVGVIRKFFLHVSRKEQKRRFHDWRSGHGRPPSRSIPVNWRDRR